MTEYGLRFVAPAGPGYERAFGPEPPVGAWLASFDPDGGADGRGAWEFSIDPGKAMRFVDARTAMRVWRMRSKRRPLRPDGKPNRPLTAVTVLVEPIPAAV